MKESPNSGSIFRAADPGRPACNVTQPAVATRQRCGRVRSIAGRPLESLEQRCAARRKRIVVHRAKDHTDADQWDLEFWQNQTPEMRLLALVELRNDLRKVRGRNRMFDDE